LEAPKVDAQEQFKSETNPKKVRTLNIKPFIRQLLYINRIVNQILIIPLPHLKLK
jgi:hypothetical protein